MIVFAIEDWEFSPWPILRHYHAVAQLMPYDLTVYVGEIKGAPTYPYVVLWGDVGLESSETLADVPDDLTVRLRVTCAGLSMDSVLITMSRVRAALNRVAPSVSEWSPGRMVQEPLQDITPDFDVNIPDIGHPWFAVDGYTLRSTKSLAAI